MTDEKGPDITVHAVTLIMAKTGAPISSPLVPQLLALMSVLHEGMTIRAHYLPLLWGEVRDELDRQIPWLVDVDTIPVEQGAVVTHQVLQEQVWPWCREFISKHGQHHGIHARRLNSWIYGKDPSELDTLAREFVNAQKAQTAH